MMLYEGNVPQQNIPSKRTVIAFLALSLKQMFSDYNRGKVGLQRGGLERPTLGCLYKRQEWCPEWWWLGQERPLWSEPFSVGQFGWTVLVSSPGWNPLMKTVISDSLTMPERIATTWLWGRVLILQLSPWLSEDSVLRSCQEAGGTQGIVPLGTALFLGV